MISLDYGPSGDAPDGGGILLSYTDATSRRLIVLSGHPWRVGEEHQRPTGSRWQTPTAKDAPRRAAWATTSPHQRPSRSPWVITRPKDSPRRTAWGEYGPGLHRSSRAPWVITRPKDDPRRSRWGIYTRTAARSSRSPWVITRPDDDHRRLPWGIYARTVERSHRHDWGVPVHLNRSHRFPFGKRRPLPAGWGVVVEIEDGGPTTNPDGTIIIPARRVYLVTNVATLTRLSDGQPLEAFDVRVGIDADSWGWSFDATLSGRMWPEVQPDANGPVAVETSINGYPFRALVESVQRTRRFGQAAVRVSGRGIAAELADPIAPVQSYANATDRTAQQLMGDVLTNTGWTVDWQVTDWLVPAGAWSHNGTPMSAINDVAAAIEAVVQADPVAKIIHVLPRYAVAPWSWGGEVPDVELPLSAVFTDRIEQRDQPNYNRVFVTGTGAGGRVGQVTRDGTAGDLVAPTVSHALITDIDASRQRGLAVLGASGRQWRIGLSSPVSDEIALMSINQLVAMDPTGDNRRGMVRSLQLSASAESNGALTVRQSADLEVHE